MLLHSFANLDGNKYGNFGTYIFSVCKGLPKEEGSGWGLILQLTNLDNEFNAQHLRSEMEIYLLYSQHFKQTANN